MEDAIETKPLGLTRNREAFQRLLEKWRITRRGPAAPRSTPGASRIPARILQRYDKDGDGRLNEQEQAEFHRAREARQGRRR